jgi:ppGpp synthetase/RelA/SpoT-type nucleotidyltranferase
VDDLERARVLWLTDEPLFRAFGRCLEERLREVVKRIGLPATVSVRTKEIDSLIKKLIQKPSHTYETLGDKLGVRVVVKRLRDIQLIRNAVDSVFACGRFENTADRLAEDQVGYLSTHVDISLLGTDQASDEFPPGKFRAELQIRTLAQDLWSEMAHDTAYKSGSVIHQGLKRQLHLLAALVEIADNDYQRVEDEIATLPDIPELRVLRTLERHYYKLASRQGDVELSLRVIRLLWPLYGKNAEELAAHFEQLFSEKQSVLADVFAEAEARPLDRSAFLFQPEILMIYDQINSMPYLLRPQWVKEFPEKELERIALRFGFSFE